MPDSAKSWQQMALGSYLLLTINIIVWESWGAPSTQTSIYAGLVLKTVPLLLLLRGILRQDIRTYLVASLFALLYLAEGVILGYSEFQRGWNIHSEFTYALIEFVLASVFILCASMFIRERGKKRTVVH